MMKESRIKKILKAEFINGQTKTDWAFMLLGITLQVLAIVIGYATGTPDNVASIVSALTGVVSVVLCAQGKISFYIFGYIQLFTYTFGVAIPNHLYGEIYENIFYVVTMIYGTWIWMKNYKYSKSTGISKIKPKRLSAFGFLLMVLVMAIGTYIMCYVLNGTNDPVPFFDSITTVPAFIAQIMLIFGYRDQWFGWIIEDISSVVMFIILHNWVMVAQYIFWTANCIYGWVKWSRDN